MDYPFPSAKPDLYFDQIKAMTEPPSLDAMFLVVVEMQQWLNNQKDHVIVVH